MSFQRVFIKERGVYSSRSYKEYNSGWLEKVKGWSSIGDSKPEYVIRNIGRIFLRYNSFYNLSFPG